MMSLPRRGTANAETAIPAAVPRILSSGKLSKISKKLKKKDPPTPMTDLPPDAPPVDCPINYECYVTMKPLKKHRLSIAKRYFGKVSRGIVRLIPEKNAKTTNDTISSEYTIDLSAVNVSCDDARRRLIFKFKTESRQIGPVNREEYDAFREMIQCHRNYRQSINRTKGGDKKDKDKDDVHEVASENAYQSFGSASALDKRIASAEPDVETPCKSREDSRAAELGEKVSKIASDIKFIATEMKQMHKELKELTKIVQGGKATSGTSAQKADEEEESSSDDSDNKMEVAGAQISQTVVDATTPKEPAKAKEEKKGLKTAASKKALAKNKISLEEITEKKDEKTIETTAEEKIQPKKRRDQLPKPALPGEELGLRQLMAIIARRIPIPISFFEPLTMLQVLCEELRYSGQTLNRAISSADPVDRIAYVTAFAVSGYAGMVGRKQKPFNPLLGETFDFISSEGWKYHAEQVSHHPAITAAHAEGMNWSWWQTLLSTPKTSWSGTVEATPELPVRVRLGKEDYCWNRVKVIIENASSTAEFRKLRMDGTMNLRCSNGYTSSIVFRKDRQTEVAGSIMDNRGILVVKLSGYYDRFLQKVNSKEYLFEAIPLPRNANQYYGFSQFACGLNEFVADEKANAAPTDSRFRPDVKALENGDAPKAIEAKANLEKVQRARNEATHKRIWFEQRQDQMTNTTLWVCNGRYWQAKEKKFKGLTDMIQLFWRRISNSDNPESQIFVLQDQGYKTARDFRTLLVILLKLTRKE